VRKSRKNAPPESLESLRVKGIGFGSLTEALDTTTAQVRLVFHMFGALAEFECSLIRERTQAGLAAARRAGRTGGGPPKLTEDDSEAAKAILANPDIGVTQIAHRLGVSPATGQVARGVRGGHERDGTDDPIRELRS
jgi:DNA invertase Pin-like site-specific DNA recombinase